MLINDTQLFIKTQFDSEAEIESVVQKYAERLFGSSIIYLPQTKISTLGGRNTVPDAIVIDVESQEWFVVEAEGSAKTREAVLQIALSLIAQRKALRVLFQDLGIGELEIHGRINKILQKTPTIAIPIDGIPKDLKEWAQTLKNNVKIWLIEKYVPVKGSGAVLYSIPDENLPTISTTPGQGDNFPTVTTTGSQPFQELLNAFPTLEGEPVFLEYGPRGKPKQTFEGTIKKEGVEVDGKVYSPSYAAVYCIQEAGSPRKTANGWIMWRTRDGTYLNALYKQIGEETEESEESLAPTDKIDVWEETTP
jgi:hypothetical protein